jgi:hypothetical protein
MLRFVASSLATCLFLGACGGTVGSGSIGGASGAGDETGAGGATGGAASGAGGSVSAGGTGGVVGTGGTTASGGAQTGTGGYPPHPPANHRVTADPCPASTVSKPPPGPVPNCASDAVCTYLPGGRCVAGSCAYDCTSDRDCGTGICRCYGSPGGDHECTWAACHVDADCPGSYCSPTFGTCGNYTGVVDYRCHTPEDECTDDSDCGAIGKPGYCMYDELVGHWNCHDSHCAG